MDLDTDNLCIRVVSFNLHGYKNNWDFLQQLLSSNNIVFVQELWFYDSELPLLSMLSNDFIVYAQSGMTNATQKGMIRGRPFGGVAVFIRKSFCHLTSLCAKDDYGRVVCVKFMSASLKMLLFGCYFPCNDNSFVYSNRVADVIGFILCAVIFQIIKCVCFG